MTKPKSRPLNGDEQRELLQLARRSLEVYLDTGKRGEFDTRSERLLEPGGAFVTLHKKNGDLRGCIGTFEADLPLIDTVVRMAIAAGASDPRFPTMAKWELDEVVLDISVLSPRWRASPEEVVVGEHGIYIYQGVNRGVLLPQVAVENEWDRETFLRHTCRKAGLAMDAWRDPTTTIELFTAQVFGEVSTEEPKPS